MKRRAMIAIVPLLIASGTAARGQGDRHAILSGHSK
jgi:hypothetical protein